jgi:hypothetical protein
MRDLEGGFVDLERRKTALVRAIPAPPARKFEIFDFVRGMGCDIQSRTEAIRSLRGTTGAPGNVPEPAA